MQQTKGSEEAEKFIESFPFVPSLSVSSVVFFLESHRHDYISEIVVPISNRTDQCL